MLQMICKNRRVSIVRMILKEARPMHHAFSVNLASMNLD